MSSALKPVLPPTGAQTSTTNSVPVKSHTGAMAQHAGAPGAYSTGSLSHVPHGNMGLPSTNMAANMSLSTVPSMSQMGGINQTPPHGAHGTHGSPIKSAALPPTAAVPAVAAATVGAAHGRPPPNSYLSGGSAPTAVPQNEGTTLPPSQNSAQLMAVHRAQQQNQHTPTDSQQTTPDRFKPQQQPQTQPIQQQQPLSQPQLPQQNQQHTPVQSNGTVSGSSDSPNNKITVPTPPTVDAKTESAPPAPAAAAATAAVPNHVTPSLNDNDVNNAKQVDSQPQPPTVETASVPTAIEQKPAVPPTAEPASEAPQQPASTPIKTAVVPKEVTAKPPSTMKLATTPRTTTTTRKRETKKVSESPKNTSSPTKTPDGKSPGAQNNRPPDKSKTPRTPSEERKSKRTRTRTQPYQSPIPELALITKLSSTTSTPSKAQDEKLIVFYKNEFLAVRNAEGGFYVCQAVQNVYKSSLRIRIRWLSQDKQDKIYIPDFYDTTEFDCILTNINMERVEKGKYSLPKDELERTENILKRALAVESGEATPSLTEEHPDGLDLSLFRDESQLKKKRKSLKRKSTEPLSDSSSTNNKRTRKTPVKSKLRKLSKSPSPKVTPKRNNQATERKSSINYNSNTISTVDKKEGAVKSSRKADGGRAERAKRRGETSPVATKTSPVVDPKKARVLAKVAMKTAIPVNTSMQNKKKADRNTPTGNGKAVSIPPAKAGVKTTRSAASASNTPAASSSASTSSTRRGKKTKK